MRRSNNPAKMPKRIPVPILLIKPTVRVIIAFNIGGISLKIPPKVDGILKATYKSYQLALILIPNCVCALTSYGTQLKALQQ